MKAHQQELVDRMLDQLKEHFDGHVLVVIAKHEDHEPTKASVAFSVHSHTLPREKIAKSTVDLFKHIKLI